MRQTLRETVHIARERHALPALMAAVVVAACALLTSGWVLAQRTSTTGDLLKTVQFQALNTCVRSNINSAIINLSARSGHQTKAQQAVSLKIAEHLYPILDCKQTQQGVATVRLSPAETDKYIKVVAEGRAPIVNHGRVIGSRVSVLAGVTSVEGAGKLPKHP